VKAQGWAISRGKLLRALRSLPAKETGNVQACKTVPESRIAWASSGVAGGSFLLYGNTVQGHWQNAGGNEANARNSLKLSQNMRF